MSALHQVRRLEVGGGDIDRDLVKEHENTLKAVETALGYQFQDRSLLLLALCHRSFTNERGLPLTQSNERLEFLGDSVIEIAVTHMLYEDFPEYPEGELTKIRAPLVQRRGLARAAEGLKLGDHVLLGRGEEATGGRQKQSILADTFEAVVGALYMDGGFEVARGLVISCVEGILHEIIKWGAGDYKSELQEWSAKRLGAVPRYRVREEGPDHYKTFHATVEVADSSFGPVTGSSKKEAEQGAARVALLKLAWTDSADGRY
jgi:ribonuclease-3